MEEVLLLAEQKATGADIHRIKNLEGVYRGSLDEADRWLKLASEARQELQKIITKARLRAVAKLSEISVTA